MNKLHKQFSNLFPAMRISFALVMLTISLILVGDLLGFTPSVRQSELNARKLMSESLAVEFTLLASDNENKVFKMLEAIINRDNIILSAGVRSSSGDLLFQVGNHDEQWGGYSDTKSTASNVLVPILKDGKEWATIELKFPPLPSELLPGIVQFTVFKLILFTLVFGFFAYLLFILRTLKELDPAAVIPGRVNAAFNTLAEGVLILDEKEQIVLANTVIADKLRCTPESLLGKKASEFNWIDQENENIKGTFPWVSGLLNKETTVGCKLGLQIVPGVSKSFIVNCAPILGDNEQSQGVLVTFDDVTVIEEKNIELTSLVTQLEKTQNEISERNKQLHYLATTDPLTGCLNRRAFYEAFDELFAHAKQTGAELSCIMADIDHFKLVNDNYGHATGDEVIKLLADILHSLTRPTDLVGRYGGEEFCIVLPGLSVQDAFSVAERIRLAVKDESINMYGDLGPNVTASLGVASIFDDAPDPAKLNDQADKALYVAKQSGRNRVIRWDPNHEAQAESDLQTSIVDSEAKEQAVKSTPIVPLAPEAESVQNLEIKRLKIQVNELEKLALGFSKELIHFQYYDLLTNLPNHALFYDRISQAINRGQRYNNFVAVITMDVSSFNYVNTTIGFDGGNIILKMVADKLVATLRKTDGLTVLRSENNETTISRLGSDTFGVLLTDLQSRDSVVGVVKRILTILSDPFHVDEDVVSIDCNMGISVYPLDADNTDDLLKHSLLAKQHSRNLSDKNQFNFYDEDIQVVYQKQIQLEKEIRRAIKNQEWVLFYQPKVDIQSRKIVGVEALIRWNHPEKGILSPYHFIEFAEKYGLIEEIGAWVLQAACMQAKEWLNMGIDDIRIAINLAPDQLRNQDFGKSVLSILDSLQLPPRYVELEVTETSLMQDIDSAIDSLNRLHSRGISLAIDDFGTGYSSLSYLKNLPVDTLKIDRAFIKDIINDDYDKNIVNTVITLAHGMNLLVVAEGVETQEQWDLLQTMSCDVIQGYLFSKPLPAIEATKFIIDSRQT